MNPTSIRHQLTLFVEQKSKDIEAIRSNYNPIQYGLIAAHVTLCRESELKDIEKIKERISDLKWSQPLQISFDTVQRFDEGKGVMLPSKTDNPQFTELRKQILGKISVSPSHAHITLMHPRNSHCNDVIFEKIKTYQLPSKLFFARVSLIEQIDGGRWEVLQSWSMTEK